jgi:hypothetical protein
MRQWIVAATLAICATAIAAAEEAPPISDAQLQRALKFVDTIGSKETFPAPTSQSLGLSDDPNAALPVRVIVTDDHKVYFCRSELNPNDYIVWWRGPDSTYSYMFLTHPDLKPVRALYLQIDEFPQIADINSTKVRSIYNHAMVALGKDVDKTPLH